MKHVYMMEKSKVSLNHHLNKMEKKEQISYTEAFKELQSIVDEIQGSSISIDELSGKVKRAIELIKICQEKLVTTEEDVNKILEELKGKGE